MVPGALDYLDAEQRAAAEAVAGPVCIIAGAGTGKTRTVTHRLAYAVSSGYVEASRALAVTHSRKAAAELGDRLAGLGAHEVDARTFHSAGLRVARVFWARTGRPEAAPSVLDERESWRCWRDCLRAVASQEPGNAELRDIIDEVGWARSCLVGAADYPAAAELAGRHPGTDPGLVVKCWERFEETKSRLGKVDFADLLELSSELLTSDEDVAAKVRRRWSHVTVDEYQDTDPAQQRLLEAVVGAGRDLCVVGDPRQAIYSWKGADSRYLTGFARRYPEAKVFDLTRNYRSVPEVLELANRLARSTGTKALVATKPSGRSPKVTRLDNENAEAAWVAGAARRAIAGGVRASEIAVLYRFNATQARFEAAFARSDVATVVADDTTFFDRDEIRAALVALERAAKARPEGNGLQALSAALARAGFDRERPPAGLGAARARWESQLALLELVEASPQGPAADAAALLADLTSLAGRAHGPAAHGVTLATLHRAKGLEWDVVFLVGMTDGQMPSSFASSAEEMAEEERLLHVGVTRARRELHLTWAASNAKGWANRPSPFLELAADLSVLGRRAAPKGDSRAAPKGDGRAGPKGEKSRRRQKAKAGPVIIVGGSLSSAECPHCAAPLKGIAARRLGVCADCVTAAPGDVGERARALVTVAKQAADDSGSDSDRLLGPGALMRLLDQRPLTADGVAATSGVGLRGEWAQKAADALCPRS
jgi:DNA helicase-2/ATP-dependent DNA helicase PcrA